MLSPEELTFVACQTTSVDIVPSIRLEGVGMLYGDVPTLRPQIRCTVPLWLASTLRQSRHCRILAPAWLHPNHLEACLEEERAKPEEFCSGLPTRYLEIFHQLQRIAREDLQPDFYKLQQLIQAIKELRNVGSLEINVAKSMLLPVQSELVNLSKCAALESKQSVSKPLFFSQQSSADKPYSTGNNSYNSSQNYTQ